MTLPLLLSVPHAGWRVPSEAARYCRLSAREIEEDGDVGAREIYRLESEVAAYQTTEIARAIVDLNRAVDDRRQDGVVKTHTCWNVPVYREFPPEDVIATLLTRYYHPYHQRLTALSETDVELGVDCHTMAEHGPPVGPDAGQERPHVCLSNGKGTCPAAWMEALRRAFRTTFGEGVNVNQPFTGGYITRTHAAELPWVQLELSRGPHKSNDEKREAVLEALRRFCEEVF